MIRALVLLLAALWVCSLAVETEHVAILKIPNPDDVVALIKRGISLDHPSKKHQTFEAYITEKDFEILKEYNVEYEIQPREVEHAQEKRGATVDYHNYAALTSITYSPTLSLLTHTPTFIPTHFYHRITHHMLERNLSLYCLPHNHFLSLLGTPPHLLLLFLTFYKPLIRALE